MHEAGETPEIPRKSRRKSFRKVVAEAIDEAAIQRREQVPHLARQQRQQAYWRARSVPESRDQHPRGLRAYSGHDLRRLPLSARAFWMLGTEFARLLGLVASPPAEGPATATTTVAAAILDARGRPAYCWQPNRYFTSADDLLLFCLLYHKAKAVRLRYPPRGHQKGQHNWDGLTGQQQRQAKRFTQQELVGWLQEHCHGKSESPEKTDKLHQSTISRWLRHGRGRLVEALRNYRHGTDEQQKIARRICKLSAELYEQVYDPGTLPASGTPAKARRPAT